MKSKKSKSPRRGRRPSGNARKPSHIPLNIGEREALRGGASRMGMPYATWARMTLLIVAEWPPECQPIRLGTMVTVDHYPLIRAGNVDSKQTSFLDGGK